MTNVTICYKCGDPGDIEIEDGSVICERCEDEYQAFLRTEYPFGQCQECSAEGFEWNCEQDKVHVVFMHSEGGCSQWGDREPLDDRAIAMGFCSAGCQPAAEVYSYMATVDIDGDLALAPF